MDWSWLGRSRSVARHLVDQLAAWGCERIYGVIGDANLELLDELSKQEKIQYIACKHEAAAALMASAEAKLTGKVGVCMATSGPGLACLLNGLADAASDRAPVLAITGQVERKKLGTGAKQEIDQQRLVDPLAVYTAMVADAAGFPVQLNMAWRSAQARAGVAHLSVPKDLWSEMVVGPVFPPSPRMLPPLPDDAEMGVAVKAIQEADRPVILGGRGIEGAVDDVLRLADHIQAPIIVTMPVKAFVPDDHPWFVGGLGKAGSEAATELLKQADLAVILGATWWPEDDVPKHVPIVQVDAAADNIGRTHPCTAMVAGDVKEVITRWLRSMGPKRNEEWAEETRRRREEWKRRMQAESEAETNGSGLLTPQRVMAVIGRHVDPGAVIAVDVGDHTLWFERSFPLRNQDVLISGRWRTLGFALPAAISAKLVHPDRQVVAIAGDGGFMTTLPDLITAVQNRIPVTVMILNNGSYAMEKNRMQAEGMAPLGAELMNPDFVRLAEAFGARGFRAESEEQLEGAVSLALECGEPAVVEIVCADTPVPHAK
jgi:pyruvate oxidase